MLQTGRREPPLRDRGHAERRENLQVKRAPVQEPAGGAHRRRVGQPSSRSARPCPRPTTRNGGRGRRFAPGRRRHRGGRNLANAVVRASRTRVCLRSLSSYDRTPAEFPWRHSVPDAERTIERVPQKCRSRWSSIDDTVSLSSGFEGKNAKTQGCSGAAKQYTGSGDGSGSLPVPLSPFVLVFLLCALASLRLCVRFPVGDRGGIAW